MANEFVARNGIIAKDNSTITGTLAVSGNITMGGVIVATRTWVTGTALTGYATESYVTTAISNLIDSAPGALDTLNELAAALGDDPNFATTVTTSIGTKVSKAGDTMTGNINWGTSDRGLTWSMNTDGAYIKFYNTGDGDTNSRLEYGTSDNGNEFHRWMVSTAEEMTLKSDGLRVTDSIWMGGNLVATQSWVTSQNYLTTIPAEYLTQTEGDALYAPISHTHAATDITSGTLAAARLSGNYAINVTGSAATLTTARTLTIGNTGKTFNGGADVAWTLAEIGAYAATNPSGYITSSGNTSGYSGTLLAEDNRTISPSELTTVRLKFGFTSWANNNTAPYADFLHLRSYTDASGGLDNLVMFRKDAIGMRIYQQTFGSTTAYSTFKDVAFTDSSITGNAATATTLQTARTLTIGNTGKTFNGSADVSWSLAEIGAQPAGSYLTAESDTLATVTGRGATTSTTLTLARVVTTGLYGPSTSGNIPIWQYDAANTGYGIVYAEGSPDLLRIDVSGQALTGTPDFLIGPDHAQVNGNNVWHAGNDGSGSGLDADLLDGQQGSYYLDWTNVTNKPDPVITLAGAVTGAATMTDLGSITITTTATSDPVLTLAGDATGSATFTNLGNATLTVTVVDDSHTHDGRYYTETESDARFVNVTGDTVTGDLTVSGAALGVISTTAGSDAFYVDGVNGRLFTVTDSLDDSLFSVNTVAGLPVIEAFADNTVKLGPFTNPVTISSTGILSIGGLQAATQSYVDTAITNLIGGAPGALDTLNELAAAINDDASYASTITSALALKAPLASPALTGTPTAPTAATATNSTQIATTAFVKAQGYITGYTETDTLASVTGRGNTTTNHIGVTTASPINFAASGNIGTWIGGIQDATAGWSISNNGVGLKADNTTYAGIVLAPGNGLLYFGRTLAGVGTMSSWLEVNNSGVANFKLARPQHNGSNLALFSEIPTNLNQLVNGPGYTTNTGTVTSVSGTGSYGGLTLTGTVTSSGSLTLGGTPTGTWPISVSGNAATATSATTATSAATWTTARTITIGSTGKSVNGSANVSWSLAEIGAQAALTNPVTGTGTTNYLPKFTGASTIGNSQVFDNGTNVGIGTTSPSYRLDVAGGDVRFVAAASTDALVRIIASNYSTEYDARLFLGENDANGMTIEYDGSANVGFIGMNSSTEPTGAFSKRIRMSRDGSEVSFPVGNVGIGTTNPTEKLDVDSVAQSTVAKFRTSDNNYSTIEVGDSGDIYTSVYLEADNGNGQLFKYGSGWAGDSGMVGLYSSNGPIALQAGGTTKVFVQAGGNVGIGTTIPGTKLDVSGVITATGGNSTNWNTAYGWGNHASAGYGLSTGDITAVGLTASTLTLTRAAGNLTSAVPTFNQNTTGSAATLTTARTLTIGATGKTFNGSANVSWTLAEIGALGATAKAADSELLDGIDSSRFVYGNSGTRRGTNLISNWNQTDYPDVAFLSAENGGTNAPSSDYSYGMQYSFHRSGAAYRTQFVTSLYSDLDIWVRNSRDSDVWTSWKRLWHSGDFTSTNISNWNTAYGWGNHASAGYAPLASPGLTGTPTAPTATAGTNTTQIATTAFVQTAVSNLVDAAPATLDTLNELAAALGDDPNFATTVSTNIGSKVSKSGDTVTGKITFPSAVSNRPQFPGGILGLDTGDGNFDIWGISRDYYPSNATAANAWGLRWNGDNNDFEFVGGGTNRVILDMDSGNLTVGGTITENSSIRYKENIVDLEFATEKVEQLRPVRYNKIETEQEEIGLIAEEVAEIYPEVVTYNEEGQPDGVNYTRLSVILLKSVQELAERINKLENK